MNFLALFWAPLTDLQPPGLLSQRAAPGEGHMCWDAHVGGRNGDRTGTLAALFQLEQYL